jgi:hypothetical protein
MRAGLLAGVLWSFVAVGWAQTPDVAVETFHAPADLHWRVIATGDVKAAYRLLKENHPGAAPELHDAAFLQRLNSGYALALERAGKIDSYQGYLATLSCLDVTDDWLKLGVLHVGQTTDSDTQYSEVREQYLPSGYSLFSTLQAVSRDQK